MPPRQRSSSGRRGSDFVAAVGELLNELTALGFEPTLVGGMAIATLGSPRVTKNFDFLVIEEAREQDALVRVFYRHGFQLASRTDDQGTIIRTIDSQRVAGARLRTDRPKSAYFYNARLGLRVDLLFDFPISACAVRQRSTRRKIQSYSFHIASTRDLIRMKEIAATDRKSSTDLQDLEFLKRL